MDRPAIEKRMDSVSTSDQLTDDFFFRSMMDTTPDSVYFKDRDCRLVRVSRSMAQRLGYDDPDDLKGKTDVDLFGEVFGRRTYIEERRVMESGEPLVGVVESRPLGDAHVNWTLTSKTPLRDATGAVVGLMGITREINELKRTELDLQHLATHDMLTGLPNRYLLMDRLTQVLAHSRRAKASFAVLFLDVDDFKAINDDNGHDFGDLVIETMASRLVENVRASDTVARVGGDEFVIVIEALGKREDVTIVAAKIRERLARPMILQRRRVTATVSIGISFFPENGDDTEVLVRAADYAMYLAKRAGKDRWQTCPKGMPGLDADFLAG
jgi:diguanylate cyclase (GGDEF)-like protein/PAS domain S-box-containing protein